MEKKNHLWTNAMNFGAILGLSLILVSVVSYVLNLQTSPVLGYLNYVIMGVLMFFSGKTLRDKYDGGYIKYGRALGASFLTGFFGGIILSFYTYIFLKYIDPSFLEQMKILTEQKLIERGIPQSQIDMSLKMINPGIIVFGTIFSFSFWGLLLGLIISFFVRKEDNTTTIEKNETTD